MRRLISLGVKNDLAVGRSNGRRDKISLYIESIDYINFDVFLVGDAKISKLVGVLNLEHAT